MKEGGNERETMSGCDTGEADRGGGGYTVIALATFVAFARKYAANCLVKARTWPVHVEADVACCERDALRLAASRRGTRHGKAAPADLLHRVAAVQRAHVNPAKSGKRRDEKWSDGVLSASAMSTLGQHKSLRTSSRAKAARPTCARRPALKPGWQQTRQQHWTQPC